MAERICEKYPQLDVAQIDKLLLMDASQLDTILDSRVDAATLLEAAETGISYQTFKELSNGASHKHLDS
jgi:hypothetical protein